MNYIGDPQAAADLVGKPLMLVVHMLIIKQESNSDWQDPQQPSGHKNLMACVAAVPQGPTRSVSFPGVPFHTCGCVRWWNGYSPIHSWLFSRNITITRFCFSYEWCTHAWPSVSESRLWKNIVQSIWQVWRRASNSVPTFSSRAQLRQIAPHFEMLVDHKRERERGGK